MRVHEAGDESRQVAVEVEGCCLGVLVRLEALEAPLEIHPSRFRFVDVLIAVDVGRIAGRRGFGDLNGGRPRRCTLRSGPLT
jgi:hypothetical protein